MSEKSSDMSERAFLSVRETAARFGVSIMQVRKWISTGILPALKLGGRYFIPKEATLWHSSELNETTLQKAIIEFYNASRPDLGIPRHEFPDAVCVCPELEYKVMELLRDGYGPPEMEAYVSDDYPPGFWAVMKKSSLDRSASARTSRWQGQKSIKPVRPGRNVRFIMEEADFRKDRYYLVDPITGEVISLQEAKGDEGAEDSKG
jgi:excisionase family DNA binding protein